MFLRTVLRYRIKKRIHTDLNPGKRVPVVLTQSCRPSGGEKLRPSGGGQGGQLTVSCVQRTAAEAAHLLLPTHILHLQQYRTLQPLGYQAVEAQEDT